MSDSLAVLSCVKNIKPLVSVVLPVYNGEDFLSSAIDSILAQTFKEFELIALDDGSKDGSIRILKEYEEKDSRVRIISRANRGLPTTLNEAIYQARGELIARMDQDDISLPNRLALQYEFMTNHPDVVVLGSAARFMDVNGDPICTYSPPTEDGILRNFFPNSPFIHPSVMFRKKDFILAGKYPETMRWGGEDLVVFRRFSRLGFFYNLSEPLLNYRLVPGSMSRKPPAFRAILTEILRCHAEGQSPTNEQLLALQNEASKIDKSKALFDYYFEVAKLCIWSGADKKKIFKYLGKCIELRKSVPKVLLMYIIACMPAIFVTKLFYKLKGRRYENI